MLSLSVSIYIYLSRSLFLCLELYYCISAMEFLPFLPTMTHLFGPPYDDAVGMLRKYCCAKKLKIFAFSPQKGKQILFSFFANIRKKACCENFTKPKSKHFRPPPPPPEMTMANVRSCHDPLSLCCI